MSHDTVVSLLGAEAIARLQQPIASAVGLPGRAYTDPAFFRLEQTGLFPRGWVGVAFAEDIPDCGDALPVAIGDKPIVLVRAENCDIRAFHNVCRHRAILVVREAARGLTNLQCPYHAWTYGLDGALKATPYWDGTPGGSAGLDKSANGLVPVRVGVWNHVVFVNLDGKAAPLDEYLAPAVASLDPVDLGTWRLGHRATWEFQANWKLVLENWENYHHVWVHEGIFLKMSEEVDVATGECYTESVPDGNVMILRRKSSAPARSVGPTVATATLPRIPGRNGAGSAFAGQTTAVLPNTTMTMGPSVYAPVVYTPIATRQGGPQSFVEEGAGECRWKAWIGASQHQKHSTPS